MRAVILSILLAATWPDNPQVKRVIADSRTLAAAVEAYAGEHGGEYPRADSMATLRPILDPMYVRGLRVTDPWETDYRYSVTDDAQHYRLVCAGSDRKFEKAYDRMTAQGPKQQLSPDDAADIVYQDGAFRVVPEGFERAFTLREQRRVIPFP